ncbi:MAG: STAS domain-containing protein, partial [Gemmatimonadales bacterium]|nr:STAS domain-containing protein [Gemmatimonadales bacterium]
MNDQAKETGSATDQARNGHRWSSRFSVLWARAGKESRFLLHPARTLEKYKRSNLRPDLLAGLTVAVVLLPQAIAYAMIAELPPEIGLYAAIVGAIVGALWGSSRHLHTGPTNATSLLVLASLLSVARPGTPEFLAAAGYLAILVGIMKLVMGLLRMGVLVNFVADSVILGFTAGAGLLISINQARHMLRIDLDSAPEVFQTIRFLGGNIQETHLLSLGLGLGVILVVSLIRKWKPAWPSALIGMILAAAATGLLNLDERGVRVLGAMPRSMPPLANLPLLSPVLLWKLSAGALAITAIGLVEAVSISRTIAAQSGQRLDSNQEFVGQGLASIVTGFFSGYPVSGSFTRTVVNYNSGGNTPLASVFSGLWIMVAMVLLAPLAVYLPRAALAGVLLVMAYSMVDRHEVKKILRTSFGDSSVMVATFLATVLLPLEFAVLAGMLVSFGRYLIKTSNPGVYPVVPDENFRHFIKVTTEPSCPQLGVMEIEGSLYFGAVHHVEEALRENLAANPDQQFLLLRMHMVDHCDVSGIHMLESIVKLYRRMGGSVYLEGLRPRVMHMISLYGFDRMLHPENILDSDDAIAHIFQKVLHPGYCIYECGERVFAECQALPKDDHAASYPPVGEISKHEIKEIQPSELNDWLFKDDGLVFVLDVGEPGEYRNWHIPQAGSMPLRNLAKNTDELPKVIPIVFVSRTGRRSGFAVSMAMDKGFTEVYNLRGGMLAWQGAGLG